MIPPAVRTEDPELAAALRLLVDRVVRLRKLAGFHVPDSILHTGGRLIVESLMAIVGIDPFEGTAADMLRDLEEAAGELLVPLPEPGSIEAKLLSANALMRAKIKDYDSRIRLLVEPAGGEGRPFDEDDCALLPIKYHKAARRLFAGLAFPEEPSP